MDIEAIRTYCLSKKATEECFPFDDVTLVFKVMGKMFLLISLDAQPPSFNAKCEPEKAIELRENHSCVQPGYHMSKIHWNTITCDGSVSKTLIKQWIDDSYDLAVKSLTKKLQKELQEM